MSFHGGMAFLPLRTELQKRVRSSWGNLRRSNEPWPGLTMRGPWQCEQMCLKTPEPSSNCAFEGGGSGAFCDHAGSDRVTNVAAATTQAASLIRNSRQKNHRRRPAARGASV